MGGKPRFCLTNFICDALICVGFPAVVVFRVGVCARVSLRDRDREQVSEIDIERETLMRGIC